MCKNGMRETAIEAACAHLGAAVVQSIPADDQIIMDHVRAAYEILKVVQDADRQLEKAAPEEPERPEDPSAAERALEVLGRE